MTTSIILNTLPGKKVKQKKNWDNNQKTATAYAQWVYEEIGERKDALKRIHKKTGSLDMEHFYSH